MEVNRYLRKDRIDKNKYAPIRITVYMQGERVHISTGEKCKIEHWDEPMQQMYPKAPYANVINTKLDLWCNTLTDIYHDYKRSGEPLNVAILKEEHQLRLNKLAAPPEPEAIQELDAPGASDFFTLFEKWRDWQANKRQKGTGRKTSPNTTKGVNSSIKRFREFEKHRDQAITLEGCDKQFYAEFESYMMDKLDQGINTFGKHIAKLKSFLKWCEEELDLDVNRRYRKFEAPSVYVGVDALTARELESIYNLDFKSAEVRIKVHAGYSEKTAPELNDPLIDKHLKELEIARDIFLMCCYTGLRISDVIKLNYSYFKAEHIEIPANKTLNTCYIPLYDDSLFKPSEILARYEGLYENCLPPCPLINEHLKVIARLIKLKRLVLSTKIGRKTFVTLKLYQGIPSRLVMQATGHKTESAFNRYAGTDTNELVSEFKRQSAKMGARVGAKVGAV